ncbi:MAG TPA: tetratricopeptide repeat protein, partial [Candidatus Omnitrophica bacterium]|nr:tetratricopeptide repeat protein [Candidatus Omnitrophota bacterium]
MRFRLIIFLTTFLFIFSLFSKELEEEKFYIAHKAFEDGFYEASISLFKRFIEEFPQSQKIYLAKLYIAKSYCFKKEYLKAQELLKEIEDVEGLKDEVFYWLGEINFQGKNFSEAFNYAKQIIDSSPFSKFYWWAHYLAGKSYLKLPQKEKEGETFLKKVIKNSEEEKLLDNVYDLLLDFYLQNKDYLQIISLGKEYLTRSPQGETKVKVYFYLGKSYYAYQKYNNAISNYQIALRLNQEEYLNDLILKDLGFVLLEDNRIQEAKEIIEKIKNEELRIFSRGVYYFKIEDYLKALKEIDSFLKKFPQSDFLPNVYLNKAEVFYKTGRLKDAISLYQKILKGFSASEYKDILDKAHYGLAWSYLKNGEFKRAIQEFHNTLKYTDNPIVKISSQIQIADAYQETEKYQEALKIYNEILKKNPNTIYADYIQFQIGVIFLKLKDLEKAYLAFKILEKNFSHSKLIPQAKYYLAVGYFGAKEYKEAERILVEFINNYSKHRLLSKVYYLYGKCLFNQGKMESSLNIFKKIKEEFKDKEVEELLFIDMGNIYLNLSMPEEAKKIWDNFLNKFPKSSYAGSVALYLGGLYEGEKNYKKAEEYYQMVIRKWPDSVWVNDALFSLGHLYLNKDDLEKAKEYFKKVIELETPLSLRAKLYLAKIYAREEKIKKALKIYDELVKSNSSIWKVALLEKAFLLKEKKDYLKAIDLFKKAIKEDLDAPKVRFYLGLCLEKINRNKEAIEEYLRVIYTFNDQDYKIKSYFRIAKIYEKEKKYEEAKKIYEKIVTLNVEESKIAKEKI